MADSLHHRGGRDRERINVNQSYELRDWADKFGVSEQQLKEAVAAVGDDASKVEAHLRERGSASGSTSSARGAGGSARSDGPSTTRERDAKR